VRVCVREIVCVCECRERQRRFIRCPTDGTNQNQWVGIAETSLPNKLERSAALK